jgi:hypothetical protein
MKNDYLLIYKIERNLRTNTYTLRRRDLKPIKMYDSVNPPMALEYAEPEQAFNVAKYLYDEQIATEANWDAYGERLWRC